MSEANELFDSLYERMSEGLEGLSEADQALTAEMLKEYCWLCVQIYLLRKQIDEEGALIEITKGNNSYKHKAVVENPAIKTLVRFQTQKSSYYTKLHKVVNIDGTEDEIEEQDELAAWFKKNS